LRTHPAATHPDLVVGTATSDDAGVFRVSEGSALVQTVDFFTPIVDDAYDWGRIAAANALSDIYAMGAIPLTALQLVGWPRDTLGFDLLGEVIRGGANVMGEAGCTIVGGHSIDDAEPKYGFAVTGTADPDRIVTNAAARTGDVLVLTKPIGTGIIATALKGGACNPDVLEAAVRWMTTLNRAAGVAMLAAGAHAATDVTGFGLLGHLAEITTASRVGAEIDVARVPVMDGAWELLEAGFYPGGSVRNVEAISPLLEGVDDPSTVRMLCDAQTSGGMLIAVGPDRVSRLLDDLPVAAIVGRIVAGSDGMISLV